VAALTRRLAARGYVALAVDLLSREGGSAAQSDERARTLLASAPGARHVDDCIDALAYARAQPFVRVRRAGVVGFGLGGGVAWRVAASAPDVAAGVSFYGLPVAPADAAMMQAAMLAIHAGRDERVNAMLPAVEAAMRSSGRTLKVVVLPDVEQGFMDDTSERYDAGAARVAWAEAGGWLRRYLGAA
jgi:carboxymethylenebutenolidase